VTANVRNRSSSIAIEVEVDAPLAHGRNDRGSGHRRLREQYLDLEMEALAMMKREQPPRVRDTRHTIAPATGDCRRRAANIGGYMTDEIAFPSQSLPSMPRITGEA
jgi:hypothetical protein